jgi:hypothetical protein
MAGHGQGDDMQSPNGVLDNRDTMQREAWIDGEMATALAAWQLRIQG